MLQLHSRIGFELELTAPVGRSRQDLAQAIAAHYHAKIIPFFHGQEEPSQLPGQPIFENLTPGFRLEDGQGNWLGSCVDDLTLQQDFDKKIQSLPGWYRIVSDDRRLLQLVVRHCDPRQSLDQILNPLAELFGTKPQIRANGMVQIFDVLGNSVAIAAPLPGERERPCEWITPPLSENHGEYLSQLLRTVQDLDFSIPQEAALHLHFDARPLCQTITFQRVVTLLHRYRDALKTHVGTNPHCRRLALWDEKLLAIALDPNFAVLPWEMAIERLKQAKLTKYCDFNLKNWVYGLPEKFTLEIRILPMSLNATKILAMAKLFESVIDFAKTSKPLPDSTDINDLFAVLELN